MAKWNEALHPRGHGGKFAAVRQSVRQTNAARRANTIEKAKAAEEKHYAKARLSEHRFGQTVHSSYHVDKSMAAGERLAKARDKNKAAGFNSKGERIGNPIGMRAVKKQKAARREAAQQKQLAKYRAQAKRK